MKLPARKVARKWPENPVNHEVLRRQVSWVKAHDSRISLLLCTALARGRPAFFRPMISMKLGRVHLGLQGSLLYRVMCLANKRRVLIVNKMNRCRHAAVHSVFSMISLLVYLARGGSKFEQ